MGDDPETTAPLILVVDDAADARLHVLPLPAHPSLPGDRSGQWGGGDSPVA